MDSLTDDIMDFVLTRAERLGKVLLEDERYKKLDKVASASEKAMAKTFNEDQRELYLVYEADFNAMNGFLEGEMYRAGIIDGLRIAGMISRNQ